MITIEQMVQREVNCCLSSLIYTLSQGGCGDGANGKHDLADLCEQAFELASPVPDYEEAAIQAGWFLARGDWYRNKNHDREVHRKSWQDLCEQEEFAGDGAIDPYDREVYEHWAVSNWLAEKLIEQGEKVDTDFAGMNVWARTCTGQGIASDGVIERIYAALLNRDVKEKYGAEA